MEKKRKFYYMLWWKELLYMILPMLVILSISVVISDSLSKSTISRHQSVIHYAISALETRFENMGFTAYQIMNSEYIQDLMTLPKEDTPQYFYQIKTLKDEFLKQINRMNFNNIVVYFEKNDMVLSGSSFCTDGEKYYPQVFQYGDLSTEEFHQLLKDAPQNKVRRVESLKLGQEFYRGISFLYSDTLPRDPESGVYLFLIVDQSYMDSLFTSLTENSTYISVTDMGGNLLYNNGVAAPVGTEEQLMEEYFVTETVSRSQLTFRSYSPKSVVLKQVRILYLALIGLTIMVLATILIFFIRKCRINGKYMQGIAAVTGMQLWKKNQNVFESIYHAMNSIIQDKQELYLSMDKTRRTLRKDFFIRLLTGDFVYQEEISLYGEYADINFADNRYFFLLVSGYYPRSDVSIEDIYSLKAVNRMAAKQLETLVGTQDYVLWNGSEELIIILNADGFSLEDCRQRAVELLQAYQAVAEEHGLQFSSCISEAPYGIPSLNALYYECEKKIYQMFLQNVSQEVTSTIPLREEKADGEQTEIMTAAPFGREKFSTINLILDEPRNLLIDACTNGNATESLQLLKQIFYQSIVENDIDYKIKNTLMTICKSIVVKASKDKEHDFSRIFECMNALNLSPALFQFLSGCLMEICKSNLRFSEGGTNHALYQKISSYVDENLSDQDMSLKTLSAALGFTPTYFSALFKEIMGDNFFQYIYTRRMLLAKQLLEAGSIKVEDVGIQCGYANVSSFRRAFKKFYGVNPSQMV